MPRIRVASLNGDAREDLVIGDGSNDRFIVLTGEANGSMALVGRFGTGDDVQDIAVADMDLDGDMDIALALRTIVVPTASWSPPAKANAPDHRWTYHVQAGAGVVLDSAPGKEFEETVNKARALARAIELAERAFG